MTVPFFTYVTIYVLLSYNHIKEICIMLSASNMILESFIRIQCDLLKNLETLGG